jgi:hypothetical protein
MRTLSAELLGLIVVFQPLFTKPSWENAKVLLLGVLLARGKRTVTACLRVVGLSCEEHFQNYHRVLNRAKWSALDAARILLGLIILIFAAALQKTIVHSEIGAAPISEWTKSSRKGGLEISSTRAKRKRALCG